jgi:diguanylate cyclase (GGDEF)-like protein
MKTEITKVEERTKVLEREVLIDILTGVHNRRAYEQRIMEEFKRFGQNAQPFSLILFDVDHFKRVNDEYGHRAGDKCLKEIINIIKPSLRDSDFLARYGGEEFVLMLVGTRKDSAHKTAERIRRLIEKTRFLYQKEEIPITLSMGVTQVDPADHDPETLFERVDAALYRAKRGGRNKVCVL